MLHNEILNLKVLFPLTKKGSGRPKMEEVEQRSKEHLPDDMYYNYEELHSRPLVTPGCDISENLLYLWYRAQMTMMMVSTCCIF